MGTTGAGTRPSEAGGEAGAERHLAVPAECTRLPLRPPGPELRTHPLWSEAAVSQQPLPLCCNGRATTVFPVSQLAPASDAKQRSWVRNPLIGSGRRTLRNSTHAPPTVNGSEAPEWPRRSPRRERLDLACQRLWRRRSAGIAASQRSHRCCCGDAGSAGLLGRSIDRKAA